ncbi:hypothetical protein [uncultured Kordia sp.]|uniref:hypothetical protein n=1 Tax=uncultured Kordia sp. TaxID=507699 RepID=UPI00261CCA31|nr:hypothetical protein [uncultured Kordia sp.]
MENDYSRRLFFKQLMLGSLGLYLFPTLHACSDEKKPLNLAPGKGAAPFNVWQEIIEALGYSSDNLPALRNHMIATKDPKKITEFVQKSLCIVPHYKNYFGYKFSSQALYGTDVALRTGIASPREKAEILKDMLIAAGFEARVVSENIPLTESEVKNILFNQKKIGFQPNIPKSQYKDWQKRLGLNDISKNVEYISNITEEADQLAQTLLDQLSEEQKKKEDTLPYKFNADQIPAVVFTKDGQEQLIHIFDATVPFGEAHPKNPSKKFGRVGSFKNPDENIKVTLSYRTAFNTSEKKPLLTGTWKASQLIGNQLKVGFLNNMSFEESVLKTVSNISSFTPVMGLQDLNKDATYLEEHSFLGEPINLTADKLIDSTFAITQEDQHKRSTKAKSIVEIEVKANPKTFPTVSLALTPRDKDGNIVEGLLANDFSIQDNGKDVKGYLTQNKIAPKILFMFDTSLSMPSAYRGKGAEKFQMDLEEKIKQIYPNAVVSMKQTGSNIYTDHLKAANQAYDLILFATDGHNNDKFNPETAQIFKQGPKTLYIKMYNSSYPDYTSVEDIAKNTGAEVLDGKDQAKTVSEIVAFLKTLPLPVYKFNYSSFDIDTHHTVNVSVVETKKTGQNDFTFSPLFDEGLGNRIIGLYLDIQISYDRKYSRVLAGWDQNISSRPTKEMAQEVHECMLGNSVISFEREGASTSIRLEEYLKAMMSNQDWFEAQKEGDTKKAIEALSKGVHTYPQVLLSVMQPLEDAFTKNTITYPTGYRIGILKTKPGLYNKTSISSFDYVRSSNYVSITKNNQNAFSETAKKTAQFALLEGKIFENSTFQTLKGKPLIVHTSQAYKEAIRDRNFGENYNYYRSYISRGHELKFVDLQSKSTSYWSMHPKTGELYGILPDQTGGGTTSTKEQLLALKEVMKQYEKLYAGLGMAALASGSGVMVGIAAVYSKTLVKLIAFATESVIIMDANLKDINGKLDLALQELACSIAKEIVYTVLGIFGQVASGLENLIGMMGGSFSFVPCPSL